MSGSTSEITSSSRLILFSQYCTDLHQATCEEIERILDRTETTIKRSYELIRRSDELLRDFPMIR